jgi:uncharacterized protein (DUF924 family)
MIQDYIYSEMMTPKRMKEELHEVLTFWYFSRTRISNYHGKLKFECLTSIDIYNQWIDVWFAKGEKQKEIDKIMMEKYNNVDSFCEHIPADVFEKIALIILFDQVTRNVFRKTEKAYAYDHIALKYTKDLLHFFDNFDFCIKLTLLLCLIHSENLDDHEFVWEKIKILHKDPKCEQIVLNSLRRIATNHGDRLKFFGRIPERNKYLNRENTQKESVYLQSIY